MAQTGVAPGPVATRMLYENESINVWEMDVGPGEEFPFHHHALEYLFYVLAPALLVVHRPGSEPYPLAAKERAVYLLPGDKSESFVNRGPGRYREVLIELKRRPRPSQGPMHRTVCEALVGQRPVPGSVRIIENDRVAVTETVIQPGAGCEPRAGQRDAVTFVIEAGSVRVSEESADGAVQTREEHRRAGQTLWEPAGRQRNLLNVGSSEYRELRVELK